jgi:hypothetical protein
MSFYGSRRAKFSTKLKIVRKRSSRTLVKKARLRATVSPQRFWLRHSPDFVSSNEKPMTCDESRTLALAYYVGLFDDGLYAPSSSDCAFDALLLNQQRLNESRFRIGRLA